MDQESFYLSLIILSFCRLGTIRRQNQIRSTGRATPTSIIPRGRAGNRRGRFMYRSIRASTRTRHDVNPGRRACYSTGLGPDHSNGVPGCDNKSPEAARSESCTCPSSSPAPGPYHLPPPLPLPLLAPTARRRRGRHQPPPHAPPPVLQQVRQGDWSVGVLRDSSSLRP